MIPDFLVYFCLDPGPQFLLHFQRFVVVLKTLIIMQIAFQGTSGLNYFLFVPSKVKLVSCVRNKCPNLSDGWLLAQSADSLCTLSIHNIRCHAFSNLKVKECISSKIMWFFRLSEYLESTSSKNGVYIWSIAYGYSLHSSQYNCGNLGNLLCGHWKLNINLIQM